MAMGTEFLIQAAIKAIGLEPEQVQKQIIYIVQTAMNIDARMRNIEEQNTEILALLKDGKDAPMDEPTAITHEKELS